MKQAKRVISLLLAVVMLFANCPISAFATSTEPASEIHEHEDFQYSILSDGTISICGYDNAPESDMEGTYLEIPGSINGATVTQIAESAFAGNTYIDTIAVPESITFVGNSAFVNCEDLKAIAFYGVIPELGSDIFEGCENLKHLYVLTGTEKEALYSEREEVSILEYEDLNSLKAAYQEYIGALDADLHVEENPVETTAAATEDVTELSETVEETAEDTAPETTAAQEVEETESATEATEPADKTTSATTEKTVPDEDDVATEKSTEATAEVTVPVNQTASDYATDNAVATLSVVSDFTYTVLNGTYCQITGYTGTETSVSIPSEIDGYIVQSIGGSVFNGNTTLTTIVFPETVETIGTYVFYGCTALTDVRLNNGLTNLGAYTFTGCTSLTQVNLPSTLTEIGERAFQGCTALTSIVIPDSVTTIGSYAFNNCTKLSEVNYPMSWSSSGSYIFAGCSSLKKIEVPEGVTKIPDNAFYGCSYLEEVTLPSTLTTIGNYAFYGCGGLKTVNLIDGLTTIPAYCFYNCTSLSQLVLPSTVTSVGNYAFYICTGLRTITMNEGLNSIGSYAFYGCDGVLSLVLNDGLETISNNAFSNCDNLKAVEVPSSVTNIGENTFDGCPKLTIYCYSGTQAHIIFESEGYTLYILDEHNHEYTTTIETAPTCTRGGSQILTCSICGYYYVEILDALGHDYSDTVVGPTCEENGYTLHECTRCDDSYQDEVVPAIGHTFGEWEVILEATCTEDGSRNRICTVCNKEETQAIPALGHVYEDVVIEPTCTAQGCTVHTCSVCNEAYADAYVDALEHNFGEWAVTKEATLLECGVRSRSCLICSKKETEEIGKITVDVENSSQYGVANFTVLDALSLTPVSGASIFIKTDCDGEATIITNENGKVSQILPVGQWPIAVYADGYLVRNITITVTAGEQDIPTIGISNKPLVDATITTTEMTYEEMVKAGIDVDSSENKHYYKYEVKILFHEELDLEELLSFVSYGDGEGNIIATVSSNTRTVYALSHDGDVVEAEAVTIIYSEEYGTYISDRTSYKNAVWTPTLGDTISFTNNGYYFEGYGIPSTLTVTTSQAFPDSGWKFDSNSGRLSMSVGERTHYLTFRDGEFCAVSSYSDSIPVSLFEKVSAENYPTGTDYVYVPAETFEAGKEYLLVQFKSTSINNREALSHDANQPDHETVTIYGDDVYGQYIVDSELFENTVWLSSAAKTDGLKIVNNNYFAQVDETILQYMPLTNEHGWVLDGEYLTTTIGEDTYYLRYGNGEYHVTDSEAYAGKVMIFEKATATDVISGSGQTETKTIYRRVYTFEEGKEYIIVGSAKNPSSGGGSGSGYSGSGGGGSSGTLSDGTMVTVYPVSEQFYLIIYGEVCWLKEIFDVEMLILNNSSTDTIENCTAELILPEGLSLATMVEGEQSAVQTVDYIKEGGSHSLHWYVRGDAEGSYNITALLSGTMMPFNEDFYYEYEAESPIKVYAGSAMKMTIYIPDTAYNEAKYVVKFELENVSDKVLYGVTHTITGWEQGKITYYSDGREPVTEEYGSSGTVGSKGIEVLYPGDKIVLEVGFDILFESSIRNSLMETANQVEQLYEAYQAMNTALDLMKGLTSFCSSASSSLDGIIKAGEITDAEKLKATNSLLSAINKLYGKFESGDSKAVKLANNIQSSEVYKKLKSCADEAGCEAFVIAETAENILELADKIESSINSEESTEETYNTFDALRTMISTIPIKYVVDSVLVSTMDGSTTTIPCSVVLTPVEAPYMGVDNWGKYIYNWIITAMGKISSPWYAQIFGAPDDVTGYDDAVAYVKQVESQIAAYSVHKELGTTFRAWIESSGASTYSTRLASADFLLETDNETAEYVDGVLTFTGNAILEVTALSAEDGILYIEDDEGNVKTIVIDTIEAHTCHSDTWNVEIAPSEDFDGYRSKHCDICGDTIAVEVLTACTEHSFGDWVMEQEATSETMGIRYRECKNCFAKEIEYLSVIKKLLNMTLMQYGAGLTVAVDGVALTDQQNANISVGGTFTVTSGSDCIVAYSTDAGATFSRLTGELVSGEEDVYRFTLPDTIEQDISLYVILRGDSNGDGEVNVFDFYRILDCLKGSDLSGIFYLAGCITDNDEVDLFDAFALLDYIETDSFSE